MRRSVPMKRSSTPGSLRSASYTPTKSSEVTRGKMKNATERIRYSLRAVALSRIEEVQPVDFRLEIPLGDFSELPDKLSVEIERDGDTLTLRAEQQTCHLR